VPITKGRTSLWSRLASPARPSVPGGPLSSSSGRAHGGDDRRFPTGRTHFRASLLSPALIGSDGQRPVQTTRIGTNVASGRDPQTARNVGGDCQRASSGHGPSTAAYVPRSQMTLSARSTVFTQVTSTSDPEDGSELPAGIVAAISTPPQAGPSFANRSQHPRIIGDSAPQAQSP